MSDDEKLLTHCRSMVYLLENIKPGAPWQLAFDISAEGIATELGLQLKTKANPKIDGPACPGCGAQPVRFNTQQGPVPVGDEAGTQLLIAQFWCFKCKTSLGMQIMGVIGKVDAPDPAGDIGHKPPSKLWSPS